MTEKNREGLLVKKILCSLSMFVCLIVSGLATSEVPEYSVECRDYEAEDVLSFKMQFREDPFVGAALKDFREKTKGEKRKTGDYVPKVTSLSIPSLVEFFSFVEGEQTWKQGDDSKVSVQLLKGTQGLF